ncbi:MAG TPA: DUF3617 family protein [Casimicrobiaceae bacterium]|nr:DUF3617 family protein [Casimicrobiaceae bacterium]
MQRTIPLFLCLALVAGAAHADEKYQRKSGLWEMKRTSSIADNDVNTYQMCIDQASDDALRQLGTAMRKERCEASKVTRNGDRLTVDASCSLSRGKEKAITHAVITGKLDSAYKIESKSTFDPPRGGHKDATAVVEAKWTGACQAGQNPGDVILPSGRKFNVNDQGPRRMLSKPMRPPAGAPRTPSSTSPTPTN